ncbi:MAG: TIGR04372 family glycosyltransferase [Rhodospirillaceae bacterium]|nr:TIGR04372 family glycosyltransferase [Rhodospirillaceae bacterium]
MTVDGVVFAGKEFRMSKSYKIFAFFLSRALGDFAIQNIVASSIKSNFENAKLFVYYRNDRPYKDLIIESNSYIDYKVQNKSKNGNFPADWFDINSGRPFVAPSREFYEIRAHDPDLVLTPSLMKMQVLPALQNIARLNFPDRGLSTVSNRLIDHGLNPGKWFCALHYRDGSYEHRPALERRDVSVEHFIEITRLIIDELGGQVVRLGNPEMAKFPKKDGLIDLASIPNSFAMQCFATSRARFLFSGPSGPGQLGSAFGTPTAVTITPQSVGAWHPHDIILMQHLIDPKGRRVPVLEATAEGYMDEIILPEILGNGGYRLEKNSLEELKRVAYMMYDRTSDCSGWREPKAETFTTFPNQICSPFTAGTTPLDVAAEIVEFPDLWRH